MRSRRTDENAARNEPDDAASGAPVAGTGTGAGSGKEARRSSGTRRAPFGSGGGRWHAQGAVHASS
ncbi:hypothetical protein GCM10009809_22350 [Isoptericola hypogeus]|uniref:Uncharacterized protein n=1 Tax=Isoptericola hypogeus TaxID=300179 RepID=A0ABP4VGD3_9MICO